MEWKSAEASVVISLLFLTVIVLLFFLPVRYRLYYRKIGRDDTLSFEMCFLNGFIKRTKSFSLLKPGGNSIKKREKIFTRWFFFRKKKIVNSNSSYLSSGQALSEYLNRLQHYGPAITLLTYLLPACYKHWLLVAEDLERKGKIDKFTWITKVGTGEAASTSILSGAFWVLKSGLLTYLSSKIKFVSQPEIKILPEYRKACLDTVFESIFHIKLGYIIIAAIIARFRLRLLKGGVGFE